MRFSWVEKVLERLIELDLLCVCVTFMDELSSLGPQTVSLVSTVVPDNPAERLSRVVRQIADGRSYAMSIAEKIPGDIRQLEGAPRIMKAFLMFKDRDFDLKHPLPPNAPALVQDLELETLFGRNGRGRQIYS